MSDNVIRLARAGDAERKPAPARQITVVETTARLRAETAFAEWMESPSWGLAHVLLALRAYRKAWLDGHPEAPK